MPRGAKGARERSALRKTALGSFPQILDAVIGRLAVELRQPVDRPALAIFSGRESGRKPPFETNLDKPAQAHRNDRHRL